MLIKTGPGIETTVMVMISFVLTGWIINEFKNISSNNNMTLDAATCHPKCFTKAKVSDYMN